MQQFSHPLSEQTMLYMISLVNRMNGKKPAGHE